VQQQQQLINGALSIIELFMFPSLLLLPPTCASTNQPAADMIQSVSGKRDHMCDSLRKVNELNNEKQ